MHRNSEHYADPTAGAAFENIEAAEREEAVGRIKALMKIIRPAVDLAGFEIVQRIVLRDKLTGREYR